MNTILNVGAVVVALLMIFGAGVLIGMSINTRKIDKAIKEARKQLEISKELTKHM